MLQVFEKTYSRFYAVILHFEHMQLCEIGELLRKITIVVFSKFYLVIGNV